MKSANSRNSGVNVRVKKFVCPEAYQYVNEVPEKLCCQMVCHQPLVDPVELPCDELHVICRHCLSQYLESSVSASCPKCGKPVTMEDVKPAHASVKRYVCDCI